MNYEKNFKTVLLVGILIVGVFTITGCAKDGNTIDPKVISTWNHTEEGIDAVYVLKQDGTGSYTITVEDNTVVKDVSYYTKNGKLFINYDNDPDTFELEYSIRDNSLVIIDSLEEKVIYNKK